MYVCVCVCVEATVRRSLRIISGCGVTWRCSRFPSVCVCVCGDDAVRGAEMRGAALYLHRTYCSSFFYTYTCVCIKKKPAQINELGPHQPFFPPPQHITCWHGKDEHVSNILLGENLSRWPAARLLHSFSPLHPQHRWQRFAQLFFFISTSFLAPHQY